MTISAISTMCSTINYGDRVIVYRFSVHSSTVYWGTLHNVTEDGKYVIAIDRIEFINCHKHDFDLIVPEVIIAETCYHANEYEVIFPKN